MSEREQVSKCCQAEYKESYFKQRYDSKVSEPTKICTDCGNECESIPIPEPKNE